LIKGLFIVKEEKFSLFQALKLAKASNPQKYLKIANKIPQKSLFPKRT